MRASTYNQGKSADRKTLRERANTGCWGHRCPSARGFIFRALHSCVCERETGRHGKRRGIRGEDIGKWKVHRFEVQKGKVSNLAFGTYDTGRVKLEFHFLHLLNREILLGLFKGFVISSEVPDPTYDLHNWNFYFLLTF